MGLTSTANTVSKLSDLAEKLYKRVEAIRKQVEKMSETVGDTNERVARLEDELAEQRALVEALAAENGVDVEATLADLDDPGADAETDDADA
ncbi:uncharacterized protein involved in exopolysaccharide biosynthesis [Halarchaeum rubridurum]|uniref:Uncharacterized protein involved in exopolysaccharide biosynthesis n=1 Tax=Halarchaeum rubridurum TaxID=489911 RepID=A0A830G2G4_9EURY|nr:DUF5798 family protein [Halarchaeum rubridurum]MBP1955440.1 uncharacterized protein involved in exopolysaccharide biosynthesis [Halarchaeum rubridurum]GGM72373.1 hypothetical protein GCM10009017_22930 [Halarchaeum rubridurum]